MSSLKSSSGPYHHLSGMLGEQGFSGFIQQVSPECWAVEIGT